MVFEILGIVAFVLYLLYDVNSVKWKNRWLHKGFFAGTVLLTAATAGILLASREAPRVLPGIRFGLNLETGVFLLLEFLFLGLLIHTLFFALPFQKTYLDNENDSPAVYKKGVYALCRHPGVLWFIGVFACLGIEFSAVRVIAAGTLFCLLNIGYVVFQDRWTFVKTFGDYEAYKRETPFLIPTAASIRNCIRTMKG